MEIVAAIKKRPGKLVLDGQVLKWSPEGGGPPIELALSNVQGMQATPPTASKLRIKLSPKEGTALMLEFSGASELERARGELQAVIKQFRDAEQNGGSPTPSTATPSAATPSAATPSTSTPSAATPSTAASNKAPATAAANGGSTSASTPSPAPSRAASSEPKKKKLSLDPAKLVQNLDLQRSVLRQDPELMRTFEQVVIKTGALTNEQFWGPRLHLLVTAAQQQVQTRGSYNVLSTIKPTTGSDNRVNINLTREKIADLFDQYPLVRRAYNENVPRLSEGEFWQRFFMSRLFLVLRGEKVTPTHATDAVLDPYIKTLHELQEKQRQRRRDEDSEHPAPLFVNVEGNAENNPETYGNNIVTTAGGSTRSLIRSMNGLSQRLLKGKRKLKETETDIMTGVGNMRSELLLHDLEPAATGEREVDLHLTDFPGAESEKAEVAAESTANVERCNRELPRQAPLEIDLHSLLSKDRETFRLAHDLVNSLTPHPELVALNGEQQQVSSEIQLVYATTLEFLKQFWYAVEHKPPAEAQALRTYLENSLARIEAVHGLPALQAVADSVNAALAVNLAN